MIENRHTYTTLRTYQERVAAMLADPECTDDLLLLGLALLDFAVLRSDRAATFNHHAAKVLGRVPDYRIRNLLRGDIRRYDALRDADSVGPARTCGAPMIRRQGPCGASAVHRALLTDADTGRQQWLAGCRRHTDWFEARVRSNRAAVEHMPVVRPAANAGGVLARHIPEIDWEAAWLRLDPAWTPPPEEEPQEVPLAPKLRLVIGGDA